MIKDHSFRELNSISVQYTQNARIRLACQRLKKARANQSKFEKQLDQVAKLYRDIILPKEKALLLAPSCELVEHLIVFLPKPSINEVQREALLLWLDSLISNIARLEPFLAESLRERVASELSCMVQTLFDQSKIENLEQILNNIKAEKLEYQNLDLSGTSTSCVSDPLDNHYLDSCFLLSTNKNWVNTIFRKTAQALHPDKEPDAFYASHKAKLMTELLVARKKQDIVKILELYFEHANAEIELNNEIQQEIICILDNEVREIKYRKFDLITGCQMTALAYDRIFAHTALEQQKNIEFTIAHFYEIRNSLIGCRKNIKSVAQLLHYLN